jgi:hypothetical protein
MQRNKMNSLKKYIYIFLIFFLSSIGCSDSSNVIQLYLPEKNPTNYVFNISRDKLVDELQKFFSDYRKKGSMLADYTKINESVNQGIPDSIKYLKYEDYFHIYEIRPYPPFSRLYLSEKGEQVHYYAHYIVRLVPISQTSTEIQILTFQNYVLLGETGTSKFIGIVCGADLKGLVTRYVPPSTIEEYEILLIIGKYLGVENEMPPIKMPIDKCILLTREN